MPASEHHGRPSGGALVVVGECMGLFLAEPGFPLEFAQSFTPSIAGAEANVAVGIARLGHRARFLGRVGDDSIGERVLRDLRAEAVDVTGVVVDPGRSTGVLIRDAMCDRPIEVVYHRTASAGSALQPSDIPDNALAGASIVHTTGITAMLSESARSTVETVLRLSRSVGVTTSLDINLRLKLSPAEAWATTLRPLLPLVDLLFVSQDELGVVIDEASDIDDAIRQIHELGPKLVVVKRGADGASASDGSINRWVPAAPVRVVDPVGAGDAFASGFLSVLMQGGGEHAQTQLDAALASGAASAAHVLAVPTDMGGLPTSADMTAALSSDRETRR